MELEDAAVVVTGATRGVGLAVARALAARGARVLAADSPGASLDSARAGAEVANLAWTACEPSDAASAQQLIDEAVKRFGRIDALVHAAGFGPRRRACTGALVDLADASYEAVVGPELRGAFFVNRAALKAMSKSRRGEIVNVVATTARKGRALDSLGSAAQAGVLGMSESLAEEMRAFGVRVQCVLAPTPIETSEAPAASVPDERVADAVLFCLGLPDDASCENLVVNAFAGGKGRARKGAAKPAAKPEETAPPA